jgi:hypothetical protein
VEARRAHNPKVVGSNPTPATKILEADRIGLLLALVVGVLVSCSLIALQKLCNHENSYHW